MKFYTRQRRTPSVIIVSLIDIFAILLIFVIVTTTFKTVQPEVVIKLPESETAAPSEQETDPIPITIDPEERIYVQAEEVPIDQLAGRLQRVLAEKPDAPLALNADTEASFGIIIRVLDVLKKNGIDANVSAFTEAAGQ
jgi:biopolymer transport protein ExbD